MNAFTGKIDGLDRGWLRGGEGLDYKNADAAKRRDRLVDMSTLFSMAYATAGMVAAAVLIAGMAFSILLAVVKKN